MNAIWITLAAALMAGAPNEARAARSAKLLDVTSVMTKMFAALDHEDAVAWHELTEPDFVAFEGGHRYDRDAFFELIRAAHNKGRRIQWSVEHPRLEAGGSVAMLIYTNRGSVTTTGVKTQVSWLEVTAFRFERGTWRATFTESMREQ